MSALLRPTGRSRHSGFTLVELLVVIAIISILASILFPVLSQGREKARQITCLSNQRQVGMAILMYVQDNDETYPNGININRDARVWPGEGWAGQCAPYTKSPALHRCPSDNWTVPGPENYTASYGYNFNFTKYADKDDPPPSGITLAELTAPAKSVLLFEVTGVAANVADPLEGAGLDGKLGVNFSADGNGLDNRLYAQETYSTSIANQYATGYLGGRKPYNPEATQFSSPEGRHSGGANYLLGDGHCRWLHGSRVSSGLNARTENCNQDNQPAINGCSGPFYAAGTASSAGMFRATFSTR